MTGNSTNGTVTLSAPLNTPSGSDVTLTIEAEAPGGDTNYVVQRFSVFNTVSIYQSPGFFLRVECAQKGFVTVDTLFIFHLSC